MTAGRRRAVLAVFGFLTAWQLGVAAWRISVLLRQGAQGGVHPLVLSPGFLADLGLAAAIALVAWWWLPREGTRSAAAWAVRFLLLVWALAAAVMLWSLAGLGMPHLLPWALLAGLALAGSWARRQPAPNRDHGPDRPGSRHPAFLLAIFLWLLQAPHLFFSYSWTDAKDTWACRAAAFDLRHGLRGIYDCLDPARPPLQSIVLWLGHTDTTFEGRLLPFLMVGAFGLLFYAVLRRGAPRLAPWGLLWLFMTVHFYQGAVTSYADVPALLAIFLGAVLSADEEARFAGPALAAAGAFLTGMAATLIKRDGAPLVLVAAAAVIWFARNRKRLALYTPVLGVAAALALWTLRPARIAAPAVYGVHLQALPAPAPALHELGVMLYGIQGIMLTHYGWGAFVWAWVIAAIWAWRSGRWPRDPRIRRWGWIGAGGWFALFLIYLVQMYTGMPGRGSLFVIRTAFTRHLLHTWAFALMHAVALVELLLFASARSDAGRETAQ